MVSWRQRRTSVALCLGLLAGAHGHAADADRVPLESAIVYNILLYVEWPNEEAAAPEAMFTLCLDPTSPVYAAAKQIEGRPLRRMKLGVQPVDGAPLRCQAVYVDTAASQRAASALSPKDPVLVLAGSKYLPTETPVVQLFETDGRLGFDISQNRAQRRNLIVSSRLLRLARKVLE